MHKKNHLLQVARVLAGCCIFAAGLNLFVIPAGLYSGGVVGLTFCPAHLGGASYEKILAHAEHYLSLGGERTLCLGCDLDGTELPDGIRNVSDLTKIADLFARHGYSDELIERIFYRNAVEFFVKNLTD